VTKLEPVESKAAWRACDLAAEGDWRLRLSSKEIDELIKATDLALKKTGAY
jgi:hypothetical protein